MKNRLLSHAITTRATVRKALPAASMEALEKAIGIAERGSSGQIRLVVEAHWPLAHVKHLAPRQRAIEWFSQMRVWDTEHNNGVLLYLLFAERRVEIIADRGLNAYVEQAQWDAICHTLESHFAAGRFAAGLAEGISTVGDILRAHFPANITPNEQPDRPVLV